MTQIFDGIEFLGILPVIAIEDAAQALPLADALLEGGLPAVEITFRTAAATEVIARIAQDRPELLVGAGTLLDPASIDLARSSGARFGLAPGFDLETFDRAADLGFPFAPGVMTPSDLSAATRRGARILKFFPAGTAGGPKALASIAAPFAHLGIKFVPTGGVSQANLGEWLSLPYVAAVGGTWIAPTGDIRAGRWAEITKRCREAVAAAKSFRPRPAAS
jgi:2-dehydro-3-deoxyphosphogluconate aldolase/(4S)-4-hydroxy-2-oxoglutarate aldolase